MSAGVSLTPLASADYDDWRALWQGYLSFYETALDDEMIDLAFQRILSGEIGEMRGLIARDSGDGAALGLTHYLYHRHGWRRGPVCYLQDLYVAEAARGRGVGRALIEAVYDAAEREGAEDVYWLTQDFNKTARQLYDRIGKATPFIKYTRG